MKGASENEEYARILSRLDKLEKEELASENDWKKSEDSFAEVESKKVDAVDEKWAHVMTRLDELEKEELAAQSDEEKDEDQKTDASERKSDEDEQTEVDFGRKNNADHNSCYQTLIHSEVIFGTAFGMVNATRLCFGNDVLIYYLSNGSISQPNHCS